MSALARALLAFTFYLGTGETSWLARTSVPLFINRRRFARLKRKPRALGRWALDSAAWTEIQTYGRWTITPRQYVAEVRRLIDEVGNLDFAATMDWPVGIQANRRSGMSIHAHQAQTIYSFLELSDLAPEIIWLPTLVGHSLDDFARHASGFESCGVDLRKVPLVGLGSLATRQHLPEVADLVMYLSRCGLRLHGFGFKRTGLQRIAGYLSSADSQSWSQEARMEARDGTRRPTPACSELSHCGNCLHRALEYRSDILQSLPRSLSYADQSALWSLTRDPHYLDIYQPTAAHRDRAVHFMVSENRLTHLIAAAQQSESEQLANAA